MQQLALFVTVLLACALARAEPAFEVCVDYHCDQTELVSPDAAFWHSLHTLFHDTADAAQERQRIRVAIARFERMAGERTGTTGDLPFNRAGAGLDGQLDCIAESRNTDTYLRQLDRFGLLRWHAVEARAVRHVWIVMTHWSAVIRDLDDGSLYAVDSWRLKNGEPPYVQPLQAWYADEPLD